MFGYVVMVRQDFLSQVVSAANGQHELFTPASHVALLVPVQTRE